YVIRPSTTNPAVPVIFATHSITVPTYTAPATTGAPQPGTGNKLDVLDGRLEHAVAAIDPTLGKIAIWTGHAVASAGGRTEFRWYEISPTPIATPTVAHSGVVKSTDLFVFNGSVAPDRVVTPSGSAHGDSMVVG